MGFNSGLKGLMFLYLLSTSELRFEPSGLLLVNKSLALSDVMECLGSLGTLLESGLLHLYFEQETAAKCHIKLLCIAVEAFKNVD
jgi:hypothetical protein